LFQLIHFFVTSPDVRVQIFQGDEANFDQKSGQIDEVVRKHIRLIACWRRRIEAEFETEQLCGVTVSWWWYNPGLSCPLRHKIVPSSCRCRIYLLLSDSCPAEEVKCL
jgi:hypothetical protein